LSPAGSINAEVAKSSSATCYWSLNLNNHQGAQFRLYQSATKDKTAYVDNFTIYYTGEEGGPIDHMTGDVNADLEVNLADVNAALDIILGGNADEDMLMRADVNGDGEINIADINALIDIILQ